VGVVVDLENFKVLDLSGCDKWPGTFLQLPCHLVPIPVTALFIFEIIRIKERNLAMVSLWFEV